MSFRSLFFVFKKKSKKSDFGLAMFLEQAIVPMSMMKTSLATVFLDK